MKRQGQIVAAILNNFSSAESSMDSMANSQGNAMEEMGVIVDSVDYKANRLKETLVGIAQNSISQDFMKDMIDNGTRFFEMIDKSSSTISPILNMINLLVGGVVTLTEKMGSLGTILATISAVKIFNGGTGRANKFCGVPHKKYARIRPCGNTERVYVKMVA